MAGQTDTCVDYERHEFECRHPSRNRRWRTVDGCSGRVCAACWFDVVVPWEDLNSWALLDPSTGIPYDVDAQTHAERMVVALSQRFGR